MTERDDAAAESPNPGVSWDKSLSTTRLGLLYKLLGAQNISLAGLMDMNFTLLYGNITDSLVPIPLECPPEKKARSPRLPQDYTGPVCNSTYDTVSCWPDTLGGYLAKVPCPTEFEGRPLNQAETATKFCDANGTWAEKADYSPCLRNQPTEEGEYHEATVRVIYHIGFAISIFALLGALFIFWYYRGLRCKKNTIHCHLMVTFVLVDLLWIVMFNFLPGLTGKTERSKNKKAYKWTCQILVASFIYLRVANFFWMLVEGVYLHLMIVWTFSVDKIKFWVYVALGWGGPFLVIVVWATVKSHATKNSTCWLPSEDHDIDFIYMGPLFFALFVNIIFLVSIWYVLFMKLRSTNTQQVRYYKTAAKGILILFPLLGVIYVILVTPPGTNATAILVFKYVNATLQGFQGLLVAVFICFLNSDVQRHVKMTFSRWREGREIASQVRRVSRQNTSIKRNAEAAPMLHRNGDAQQEEVANSLKEICNTSRVERSWGCCGDSIYPPNGLSSTETTKVMKNCPTKTEIALMAETPL